MAPSEAAVGLLGILHGAPEKIDVLRNLRRSRSPKEDAPVPARQEAKRRSRKDVFSV